MTLLSCSAWWQGCAIEWAATRHARTPLQGAPNEMPNLPRLGTDHGGSTRCGDRLLSAMPGRLAGPWRAGQDPGALCNGHASVTGLGAARTADITCLPR